MDKQSKVIDVPAQDGIDPAGLDAIIDADFSSPIEEKIRVPGNTKAYAYYQSVRPLLNQWWEEFSTELDERGRPKYRTVAAFAQAHSDDPKEQAWIRAMIGPQPLTYTVRSKNSKGRKPKYLYLKIPWLGDWKERRTNCYWAPEQPKKIKALALAIKEKMQGWDAVRSAAPYLVQELMRYTRLSEQIEAAYGGQPLDPEKGPTDPENKNRFYAYFEMQKTVTVMKLRLMNRWMMLHGVDPSNPVQVHVNNTLNQISQSQIVAQADNMTAKDLDAVKMVRMLQRQADNFKMPLPASLTAGKDTNESKTKVM